MFRTMKIPVAGGVENMSAVRCPHCGREISLFDDLPVGRSIWDLGVARLGQIPFDTALGRPTTGGELDDASVALLASISERVVASLLRGRLRKRVGLRRCVRSPRRLPERRSTRTRIGEVGTGKYDVLPRHNSSTHKTPSGSGH